jgi:hypothetical protein
MSNSVRNNRESDNEIDRQYISTTFGHWLLYPSDFLLSALVIILRRALLQDVDVCALVETHECLSIYWKALLNL